MPEIACDECGRVCISAQRLSQHSRCHIKKYMCQERQCAGKDVRFGSNRDLKRHQQTHKGIAGATSPAEHLCPFCKLPVGKGRQDNLARHVKRQHKDQLFIAAANGDETTVKHLLENGANVDVANTRKQTSLHLASRAGHTSIVRLLLDYGANVERTDSRGLTSLHHAMFNKLETIASLLAVRLPGLAEPNASKDILLLASEHGYAVVIDALLDRGADIDCATADDHWTPLTLAASNGHANCVRLLVQRKASTVARCRRTGKTPLHLAVESNTLGTLEIISILLSAGANIEAEIHWSRTISGQNETPLISAARQASVEKVQLLLAAGADIEAKRIHETPPIFFALESRDLATVRLFLPRAARHVTGNYRKDSILHHAAMTSSGEIVKFLLEQTQSPDINSTNPEKKTPLHFARDSEIAQLLIEHGADVGSRGQHGDTPLHETEDKDTARLLILHGADPSSKNDAGATPLHSASKRFAIGTVQVLLEQTSVDIHSRDEGGQTPLHYAMRAYRVPDDDLIVFLIQNGADPNAKDNNGETPLHHVVENSYFFSLEQDLPRAQLLIDNGGDPNAKNNQGETPLHVAAKGRCPTNWIPLLLRNGADPKAEDGKGRTVLQLVRRERHKTEVADILKSWENQTEERVAVAG